MKPSRVGLGLLLVLAAVAVPGCGGDDTEPTAKKTSTPTSTPKATATPKPSKGKPPSKAEIRRVNRARDQLAAACKTLKTTPDDAAALRDLRAAARTYLTVFGDSPDATFKRGPNSPEITMRRLLGAVSVYVRDNCGDGASKAVARRLIAATRKSS